MNQQLSNILLLIEQSPLPAEEKQKLLKQILDVEKQLNILEFKLDRTEKVKKSTAVLLEETIDELEQKRKAVEAQNRELEIEAALERVRAVAMSMNEPADMLDVCRIISEQLTLLGVKEIRNVQTAIFYEGKGTYMNYEYYAKHDKALITETTYSNNEIHHAFAVQMLKGNGEFFSTHIKGDEVKNWIAYQKTTNVFIDSFLETASSLNYYWHSLGAVALGISAYVPLTEDEMALFNRFLKVFELAFRRHKDIEQANAQAREAQIQLALERVRARTMAMQSSDELPQAANLLFQQVQSLGMPAWSAGYCIWDDDKKGITLWMSSEGVMQPPFRAPLTEDPSFIHMREAYERGESFFVDEIGGEDLVKHYQYMRTLPVVGEILDSIIEAGHPLPTFQIFHLAYFSYGFLLFITYEPVPEAHDIFIRFGKVFEQTYTRFLDLQKAEAQTRESQIQLALERVRARTMAMQKSGELAEVASLLFQQVNKLGIESYSSGFTVWEDDGKILVSWMCNADGSVNPPFRMPTNEIPWHIRQYQSWQSGEEFVMHDFTGEDMQAHYRYLRSFPLLDEAFKTSEAAGVKTPDRQVHNVANFSNGNLLFITPQPCPESHGIFKRFAAVFDQTYTRFLDLQKAEEQARESQIQLALERVRARTMAMQKSDELIEAAALLFQQAKLLGVPAFSCGYNIWGKNDKAFTSWMSVQDGSNLNPVPDIPLTEDPNFIRYVESKQNGEQFFILELRGERMQEHYRYLKTIPAFKSGFEYAESVGVVLPNTQIHHVANFSNGNLLFITLEPCPEFHNVFKRFAAVFEQTYTRFLDLQKAEVSAREAQIEAALERVRSKTMAMHQTSELQSVIHTVHHELLNLDLSIDGGSFVVINDDIDTELRCWGSGGTANTAEEVQVPHFNMPFCLNLVKGIKQGSGFFTEEFSQVEKKEYFTKLFEHKPWSDLSSEEKQKTLSSTGGYTRSVAVSKHTSVFIINHHGRKFTGEENDILKRFAKVFEQTYTRFLDLKKAESQAREAQIELGLERVRARAMAMQRSEELKELIGTVFIELTKLDLALTRCLIMIFDPGTKGSTWWMANSEEPSNPIGLFVQFHEHHPYSAYIKGWQEQQLKWTYILEGKIKKEWDSFLFTETELSQLPGFVIAGMKAPDRVYLNASFNSFGNLTLATLEPLSDAHFDIMLRFAKVFDLTYTRFNDLKNVEAQAREAQIQLALERVRARTMAMQKSNELTDVAELLFTQVNTLGIKTWSTGFEIWSEDDNFFTDYITNPQGGFIEPYTIDASTYSVFKEVSEAKKRGDKYHVNYEEGEQLTETYRQLRKYGEKQFNAILDSGFQFPLKQYEHFVFGTRASVMFITYDAVPEADQEIFKRFGKVFEQTYTRFLDLKNAEAQAREAQIEASLERVRSRAMAMHKSEELKEVAKEMRSQFTLLGQKELETCAIHLWDEASGQLEAWAALRSTDNTGEMIEFAATLVSKGVRILEEALQQYLAGKKDYVLINDVRNARQFFNALKTVDFKAYRFLSATIKNKQPDDICAYWSVSDFSGGSLVMVTVTPPEEDTRVLLRRFSNVFGLAYKRYVDIKKAEAQSRESQIQLALERVRARTMAMQKSDELTDVAGLLFNQLTDLGIKTWTTGFNVWSEDNNTYEDYITSPKGGFIPPYFVDTSKASVLKEISDARKSGVEFFVQYAEGEKLKECYIQLAAFGDEKQYDKMLEDGVRFPSHQYDHFVFGSKVSLMFITYEPVPEAHDVFVRLGNVFEQTYTRFLDLQRAEAQAREAQIEAAMEKVRARAMSMQTPNELVEVAQLLRKEMGLLGVEELETSSIYIHNETTGHTECWYAIQQDKKLVSDHMTIDLQDTSVGREMLAFYRSDKRQTSIVMTGEARKEWINYCADHSKVLVGFYGDVVPDRTYHLYKFSNGYMGAASPGDISAESWSLLQRATSVFSLAYTRFSDLQQAEAQAKEAKIEAALEKVRSRTLAMQKSDELAETAAVLFQQLIHLGIEPNRLYINIVKDRNGEAEFWITDEDGSKVSMAYEDNMNNNSIFKKMFEGWQQQKKSLVLDMKGKELKEYFQYLTSIHVPFKEGLEQKRRVQHLAYFSKGFIGMASPDEQPAETLTLLERFAYVFNLTYTRFNDLQIAEAHALQAEQDLIALKAAKQKAEEALTKLKATQSRLIQAEKMASLGELTAGIAHEIQNPLNFVNNFADVNRELVAELKEEAEKGNFDEVKALAVDIEENEQKISHHGKRADAIVRGMLQHSRISSGKKEPTDINALLEEFLRLSYHGLRAKDKSFNATIETQLDHSLKHVAVVPQELGRVFLNLFNNAFYAVNEKKRIIGEGFEPIIRVATQRLNGNIEIRVGDNGNGIPQKIIDKIFQPFFTTKPTGQGTGLGLSLSYDIIAKAHNGELTVETEEGKGTTFRILLPNT